MASVGNVSPKRPQNPAMALHEENAALAQRFSSPGDPGLLNKRPLSQGRNSSRADLKRTDSPKNRLVHSASTKQASTERSRILERDSCNADWTPQ
jgi:hypothetical protein